MNRLDFKMNSKELKKCKEISFGFIYSIKVTTHNCLTSEKLQKLREMIKRTFCLSLPPILPKSGSFFPVVQKSLESLELIDRKAVAVLNAFDVATLHSWSRSWFEPPDPFQRIEIRNLEIRRGWRTGGIDLEDNARCLSREKSNLAFGIRTSWSGLTPRKIIT